MRWQGREGSDNIEDRRGNSGGGGMRMGLPLFFSFLAYFAFFHQTRQFYGIFRIYDRGRTPSWGPEVVLIYALLVLPFFALHFRDLPGLGKIGRAHV